MTASTFYWQDVPDGDVPLTFIVQRNLFVKRNVTGKR